MKLEDKDHKEPRKKAKMRSHKSNTNRNRTPKVIEKTQKYNRKQNVVSSDSSHRSENPRNKLSVVDDVQPEPKSITNPSTRAKVIQFDVTKKDSNTDTFRMGRLRSNHEQTITHIDKPKNSDVCLIDKHNITSGWQSKKKTTDITIIHLV